MRHYTSVRLRTEPGAPVKVGELLVGHEGRIQVVKSKVGEPFGVSETTMLSAHGVRQIGELVNQALDLDIMEPR